MGDQYTEANLYSHGPHWGGGDKAHKARCWRQCAIELDLHILAREPAVALELG